MKLSVKIAIMFAVMTALTIILYLVSSNIMVNYLYEGEITRISGISSGVINRLEGEKGKFIGKMKDYTTMLQVVEKLEDKSDLDFMEELGMYDKFQNDSIEYKVLLSSDLKVEGVYTDKDTEKLSENDIVRFKEVVRSFIDRKEFFAYDTVSTKDGAYWVVLNTLKGEGQENLKGYFIGIKDIDKELIGQIEKSMDSNVELVHKIEFNKQKPIHSRVMNKYDMQLIYNADSVSSFYKLEGIHQEKDLYVKVKEPLVVKESVKSNINLLTGILITLYIIVNFILALIIERLVVKRIVKINKGINHINSSKNLSERIHVDESQDEIGVLENDINKMFDSLEAANESIMAKETKYSGVLKTMTNGFAYYRVERDDKGRYVDAICEEFNDALAHMLEVDKERMIGKKFSELADNSYIGTINLAEILEEIWCTEKPYTFNQLKLREDKWVNLTLYVIEKGYFTVIVNDVTTLKRYSEDMKYLAEYDFLTKLKNRHSLYKYLNKLIDNKKPFIIYFMDLDNFKTLNDTVGHIEGDKVLSIIANELIKLTEPGITIGRLGGDEFIVIQEGEYISQEVMQYGQNIIQLVNKRFEYAFYNFEIKASIGVSVYPRQADDLNTLLKYGDIAMYKAKKTGGNNIRIFTDEMMEELEIEARLKDAIVNEEFIPYYQPIFDVQNNKIIGAEALVRWMRNGEIIPPYKFIQVAKKTGHIMEIDYIMLDKACEFCKKWHANGFETFTMSVNMSFRALQRPNSVETIKEILEKHRLNPQALKIEVTEDEIIEYPKHIIKILEEIKLLGVKVSLDDFGVGYSSFNHIKMLPIDTLKIDRSLLLTIEEDSKTLSIIETLIQLAHTLGLDVVCEGIEEERQIELLKEISCDMIQGYFISQPVEEKLFYKCMEHYNMYNEENEILSV
nr:EAL domain-containing protein [uncultured Niameybacter sp.]